MTDDVVHQKALSMFMSVVIKHYECIIIHKITINEEASEDD